MGEVHADDVKAGIAEHVNLLNGVGLGANGADDGRATVVLGRGELGVEVRQPLKPGAARRTVIKVNRHFGIATGLVVRRVVDLQWRLSVGIGISKARIKQRIRGVEMRCGVQWSSIERGREEGDEEK